MGGGASPYPGRRRIAGTLAAAVLFLGLAVPAEPAAVPLDTVERGVDTVGRWGVGYSTAEAPLGFRYQWSRRYGVDLGLGFRSSEASGGRETRVVLDGGFLYALAPGERVNVFARPGVQFRNLDQEDGSTTTIRLSGALDVEVFVTERMSLGARAGVRIQTTSPPEGPNRTDFGTRHDRFAEAGFHFYLDNPR
jgi:hypothetical protein